MTSEAPTLEELTPQLIQLIDPIAELRVWAKKIVHMHGKDTSVDWDAVKRRGIYAMRDFAPHQSFPCVKGALGAAAPLQNVKNPPFDQTSKGGSAVL